MIVRLYHAINSSQQLQKVLLYTYMLNILKQAMEKYFLTTSETY